MSTFETLEMNQAVDEIKPAGGFFLSLFTNTVEHTQPKFTVDLKKGDRRVAPYTLATAKSTPFDRNKFSTSDIEPPVIKLCRSLSPVDAILRLPGESPYSNITPAERARNLMLKDMIELDLAITRAEELQAAQAIIKGSVLFKGNEVDQLVDMRRNPANTFAIGTLPSGASGWVAAANIDKDLRVLRKQAYKVSGITPTVAVLGDDALEAFLSNTAVNQRSITANSMNSNVKFTDNPLLENAIYYGMYGSFEIWSYSELYEDQAGAIVPLLDSKSVVLLSRAARCTRNYGPILHMQALVPKKRFVYEHTQMDPSEHKQVMESAPLMTTDNPDAYCSAQVLP